MSHMQTCFEPERCECAAAQAELYTFTAIERRALGYNAVKICYEWFVEGDKAVGRRWAEREQQLQGSQWSSQLQGGQHWAGREEDGEGGG